ncbi:Aste57867_3027 [Aphanomyces stellatus]|uniref:Aste57867_3027 protein n=1 Tax=Aphanomyces stellatus TaxID=120398 RepID=A0A485KE39_9STRA|nr:hypothetical protein As57867_003018 [Aphanomyces stellatus]VFT80207.1 Aste57867_3027 [Aphanomyces stellatus]
MALFSCGTMDEVIGDGLNLYQLNMDIIPVLAMRTLNLSNVQISPAGLLHLAALRESPDLTTLVLRMPTVTYPHQTAVLGELFQAVAHSNVRVLNVSGCSMDELAWDAVGLCLQASKLESLTLKNNGIADNGAVCLAKAIQSNSTLTNIELELVGNCITPPGARVLVQRRQPPLTLNLELKCECMDDRTELLALAAESGLRLTI